MNEVTNLVEPRRRPGDPNPQEVATVEVRGVRFKDWKTVWVQWRTHDPFPIFKFTAAEREPIAKVWTKIEQWKPGDRCAIYLGGVLAVSGVILTRQVAYDGTNHAVELLGVGDQYFSSKSSVMHKTHNFDGKSLKQIADEVLAPHGVTAVPEGKLDHTPFVSMQSEPGETIGNLLERLARMRGTIIGSDRFGNVLLIGKEIKPLEMQLVEGRNILKCNCTISIQHVRSETNVGGQVQVSDGLSMAQSSFQEAKVGGNAPRYYPLYLPTEQPVRTVAELARRAAYEKQWNDATKIECSIVTQGWFAKPRVLWSPRMIVLVYSPMAMLAEALGIETVTFTQDTQSGTLSTIDLKQPFALNLGSTTDVAPPPGEQAKPNNDPPVTPPKVDPLPRFPLYLDE